MSEHETFLPELSLEALFRRNVATRPDAAALVASDGAQLTYLETANAAASIAKQIASFNLAPKSTIAILLPNGFELALTLLAVMQSGHVAAPMPVAWRKADLVSACREAEAAALITTANFAAENLPQLAMDVAIEVFELSYPCAFGEGLPDGILPLGYSTAPVEAKAALFRSSGIATFAPGANAPVFTSHRDEALLAAGLGVMLAADIRGGDRIISVISFSSLAGLTSVLVPWLLSGGALMLLADFPDHPLLLDERTHLVGTPGGLSSLYDQRSEAIASAVAVDFAGAQRGTALADINARRLADVVAFGELAALALPRSDRAEPPRVPLGPITAGNAGAGSPVLIETKTDNEKRVLIRGAIVSSDARGDAWTDTGYSAQMLDGNSFYPKAAPEIVVIGALRFHLGALEARIAAAAPRARLEVFQDAILGNRLVVSAEGPEEASRALLDAGLPRIIAKSVRKADSGRKSA